MYPFCKTSHLLFLLSLLLFSFFNPTLSKQCNPYDEKLLLSIKKEFGNPSSLASWNPSTDCCKDWGSLVECNEQGRVHSLNLASSDDLSGPVPSSVGDLTFLHTFRLASHKISGQFPLAICKLTNLQYVSVTSTGLTGSIPSCLGQLYKLATLEISGNNRITGPIPASFGQLSSLTYLHLPSNKLSGPIPDSLAQMSSLTWFSVESNELSGPIPASLALLPSITSLILLNNKLSGSIPTSFGSFKNPLNLVLGRNQLTGPVPREMARIRASSVDLSDNKLTGDASFLFGRISFAINLSNNQFKFDFSKVEVQPGLKLLNISHNMIYGSIPGQLGQLGVDAIIDLSYNELCGPIPSIPRLSQLSPASLAHNKCLCGSPLPPCKGTFVSELEYEVAAALSM